MENKLHTLEDPGDKSVASRTGEVGLARGFISTRRRYEKDNFQERVAKNSL